MSEPDTEQRWAARRTSFGGGADSYAVGRPSYPREAIEWTLPSGARTVLDLAAGTGRLTEPLLDVGLDVVAVEPIDAMRAHIPAGARALAGTAEDIPLDDASVDAVVVGQAFHWFDVPRAMAEIRRVLRPGGRLGLFWNLLDDADPAIAAFAAAVGADERASAMRDDVAPPYDDVPGMAVPVRKVFRHAERYDVERAVAYALSRSQAILMPDDERAGLVAAVRAWVPADGFRLRLVTEAWRGERVG